MSVEITEENFMKKKRKVIVHRLGKTFSEFYRETIKTPEWDISGVETDFTEKIWTLMKKSKMTPKEMAEKAGMSLQLFNRLSSSSTRLTVDKMVMLARVFNKDIKISLVDKPIHVVRAVKNKRVMTIYD